MSPKKKATTKPEPETTDSKESWYEVATPTGEYLAKLEGINYYELLSEGELVSSTIKGKDVQNVEFEAIHHETLGIRQKPVDDSPEEAVEGTLSIPLSAARKVRTFMEENKIKLENIVGMILALQKTGSEINTRYPTVELIAKSEYLE